MLLFPSWQDVETLASMYRFLPHDHIQKDPYDFVNNIGYRIYTEWCLESPDNTCTNNMETYNGKAFAKFVDNEVHYLLNRQHEAGKRLNARANDTSDYTTVRNKVLEGIVKRALHLAKSDENPGYWKENLRCNLQAWVGE